MNSNGQGRTQQVNRATARKKVRLFEQGKEERWAMFITLHHRISPVPVNNLYRL
jgi:hypothetical protein